MIYLFRKEMKKWHTVLWVVFASLALSGLSLAFFRPRQWTENKVAHVNGSPIFFAEYRRALLEIQERINAMRPLARLYGMPEETFINVFFGANKPEDMAIDGCIREKLLDDPKDSFSVILDEDWFKKELATMLPQLADESGSINVNAYKQYLEHQSTKPTDFENQKREEFKRMLVQNFVQLSAYIPNFVANDMAESHLVEKSFVWTKIPVSFFTNKVTSKGIDEKELDKFYIAHKETYREKERRSASYWIIDPQKYMQAKGDIVDEAMMKHFYEKHKSALYRIAPKVKVRHILIKGLSAQDQQKATDVYKKATETPGQFADLAKKYSNDSKTAGNGGLVDFFGKGTFDEAFERASFRLKNVQEIAPVTKTKEGFEIIQLVERISASEKPYEEVKGEIAKTLKVKRSLASVRADLESVMRQSREEPAAFDSFVTKYNFPAQKTEMLSESGADAKTMEGALTTRLFSKHKQHKAQGYFQHEELYVLYKVNDVKASFIPPLNEVKEKVYEAFVRNQADGLAQNAIKEARKALIEKKQTLADVAKTFGGTVTSLEHVKQSTKPDSLPFDSALLPKLFDLVTPAMVLTHKDKDAYIIVQLKDAGTVDAGLVKGEAKKIIKQEKYKNSGMQAQAFIASLHRNAKIEVDKKFIAGQPIDVKVED